MQDDRTRARHVLEAQEGTGPLALLRDDEILQLLSGARRIAIVGASPDPGRPSHGVMRYLLGQGYDCVPVNPNADAVLGVPCYGSIEEAVETTGGFDIVDVFRRSEHAPAIARSAVETGGRALWLQLGVVNWEAAETAHAAGLAVVMDRCTAIEHRRLRRV